MSVFGAYAGHYDLLYGDKRYAAEAAAVARIVRAHAPQARRLLELGCGTAAHAVEFAQSGYTITGVDRSDAMLAAAAARLARQAPDVRDRVQLLRADARSVRLEGRYDAALALFHVLSYQATPADLAAVLRTAAAHLPAGAPFVFDFWYGPAVLAQRPQARVKRVEDADVEIVREAAPRLLEDEDCVEVHYTLRVRDKRRAGRAETLREVHRMRYFFLPALEQALDRAGMRLAAAADLESGAPLSTETWSGCVTAIRRLSGA